MPETGLSNSCLVCGQPLCLLHLYLARGSYYKTAQDSFVLVCSCAAPPQRTRSSEVNPRGFAQEATPVRLHSPQPSSRPHTEGLPYKSVAPRGGASPARPTSPAPLGARPPAAPPHLGCGPWRGRAGGRRAAPPPPAAAAPSRRAAPWPGLGAFRRPQHCAGAAAPPPQGPARPRPLGPPGGQGCEPRAV